MRGPGAFLGAEEDADLGSARSRHKHRYTFTLNADLENSLFAPPHVQHWPATLDRLTLVQAAVQAPVVVVLSSLSPPVGSTETTPLPRLWKLMYGFTMSANLSLFLSC